MALLKRHKPYLIIPDTHAPYHHRDTLEFLKEVHKKYKCHDTVIHVGDIFDFHAISKYTVELDAPTATEEYQRALEFSEKLVKIFPKGVLILGNHDTRAKSSLELMGVPIELLKKPKDLFGLPKGWKVEPLCHVIKEYDVLCEHGCGSNGPNGALTTAIYKRTSFVQGHTHSEAGCKYSANHDSLIFGLNVGCLIDNTSLAMRYGKYLKKKGILGCGVVFSASHAEFIPLELNKKGRKK
jgi:predicted phosphodiesterase